MRLLIVVLGAVQAAFACTELQLDAPRVLSKMQAQWAVLTDASGLGLSAQATILEQQPVSDQQFNGKKSLMQELQFKEEIMDRIEDARAAELDQGAHLMRQQFKAEMESRKLDVLQLASSAEGELREEQAQESVMVAASRRLLIDSGKPATTAMCVHIIA